MLPPNPRKHKPSSSISSIARVGTGPLAASREQQTQNQQKKDDDHQPSPKKDDGIAISLIVVLISLVRLLKLPFRRVHMSTKSILPSYHQSDLAGGPRGRHTHHVKAQHHYSPSRRKKTRLCCWLPRLRHLLVLFLTVVFILYVTDCLHLHKRISLKKESGINHLQTTTWNFRLTRGPIDLSLGEFRTKGIVELHYNPS